MTRSRRSALRLAISLLRSDFAIAPVLGYSDTRLRARTVRILAVTVPTAKHMLLTIRTTHQPATDLGFLLHKHPEHVHTREFPFGNATVFYLEASEESCTAAVLVDVDPVGMVRGRGGKGGAERATWRPGSATP